VTSHDCGLRSVALPEAAGQYPVSWRSQVMSFGALNMSL
jgi:hypothetical protein